MDRRLRRNLTTHVRKTGADHGRCLQGCLGAGYDDSSVSDITHRAGVVAFGTMGVASKRPSRSGSGLDMAACNVVWGMVEDE